MMAYRTIETSGPLSPRDGEPHGRAILFGPPISDEIMLRLSRDGASLAGAFAEQVEATPDLIAIRDNGDAFTYRELAWLAGGVVRALRSVHRTRMRRVGILCDHNVKMVAATMGTLAAGLTYVPLDPALPEARLQAITSDCDIDVVLTEAHHVSAAKRFTPISADIICWDSIASEKTPFSPVSREHIAYILYTSGTTGHAKGVIQSNRNALYFALIYSESAGIKVGSNVLMVARAGFDAALMDMFGALLSGATLCLFDVKSRGLTSLPAWVASHRITVWHSTPTILRSVARYLRNAHTESVNVVVLGGEPATRGDAETIQEKFPADCKVINGLGPTESTLALQYVVAADNLKNWSLPIGTPVPGTNATLIEAGSGAYELAITSDFVALGYLNDPVKTQEKFITIGDRRAYLTGDLVQLTEAGEILHVGRRDSQVKIHGVRVEIAEIETILRRHPSIFEAVVVIDTTSGSTELAAYIVSADFSDKQVRSWLALSLPNAMIPKYIINVGSIPYTINGKLDREALRYVTTAPERAVLADKETSPLTQGIRSVWSCLLHHENFTVDDSFFDVGGDSLMALNLLAELEAEHGVTVSPADFFQSPTIGFLLRSTQNPYTPSICIDRSTYGTIRQLKEGSSGVAICFIHPISGSLESYVNLSAHLPNDIAVWGISPNQQKQAEIGDIQTVAAEYIELLPAISLSGAARLVLCGWSYGGIIAFEMARQLDAAAQRPAHVVIIDTMPHLGRRLNGNDREIWRSFAKDFVGHVPDILRSRSSSFWNERFEAQLIKFKEMAIAANSIFFRPELGIWHTEQLFSYYRSAMQARDVYKATPISGSLTAIVAARASTLTRGTAWQRLATTVEVMLIGGSHAGIMRAPLASRTAQALVTQVRKFVG